MNDERFKCVGCGAEIGYINLHYRGASPSKCSTCKHKTALVNHAKYRARKRKILPVKGSKKIDYVLNSGGFVALQDWKKFGYHSYGTMKSTMYKLQKTSTLNIKSKTVYYIE